MSARCDARSPFAEWRPAQYLRHYCAEVAEDERATLRFLVEELAGMAPVARAVDFGAGPTLHHVLPLARLAQSIDVADLLEGNLDEIRRWQQGAPGAHDWSAFTRVVLELEGRAAHPAAQREREGLLRSRLGRLLRADAGHADPLGPAGRGQYGIVLSCYCADSATADPATCRRYLSNIASLLAPGGLLLLACLRRCAAYRIGPSRFPSARLDEHQLAAWLAAPELALQAGRLRVAPTPRQRALGYDAVLLASARRRLP